MNGSPRPGSPATRALWVIAFSLLLIAGCLVIMVSRQMFRPRQSTTTSTREPGTGKAAAMQEKPVPPLLRKPRFDRPTNHVAPHWEAALTEPGPQVVRAINEQPAVPQAQSPQWQVSGGLAPLTGLKPTNTPTVITGRVTLKGVPPPETALFLDALCGKVHAMPKTTRHYVVSTNGGLADVFVYIRSGLEGKSFSPQLQLATLDQVGCEFEPYVVGLMLNQPLKIKNSDPMLHNVHVLPQGRSNQAFNWAATAGSMTEKSFGTKEIPVRLRCDLHPWMFAYLCVTDNPFFAVTDLNGSYSITNVPPGDYVLEVYHVKTHGNHTGETQSIIVRPGETTTADFVIAAPMHK